MRLTRVKWHVTCLKWLDRASKSASIILGGLAKATPAAFPALLAPAVQELQGGLWIPTALILTPAIAAIRRRADKSKLDQVHLLLDQICECTFKNETFHLEQHRRVTLFKYKTSTWRKVPFVGGWLLPIERSGISGRSTNAIFRAHDDGEMCSGVAGRAWTRRSTIYVNDLPDLTSAGSGGKLSEYEEKTFMKSGQYGKGRMPKARSLLGIPIEIDGKKWGVIVIDSIHPNLKRKVAEKIFKNLNPSLTILLKGL